MAIFPSRLHRPRREWTRVGQLGVEIHARVWDKAAAGPKSPTLVLVAGMGVSSRY